MHLKKMLNKLLENKNFYYVIIALTVFNLIMYAYHGLYKAISFFILCAIIAYNFTKSPTIVLLLCLIATHFFITSKTIYEGLENKNNVSETKNSDNIDKLKSIDPELANVATKVNEGNKDDINKIVNAKKRASKIKDPNNPDLNETTNDSEEPVPESFEGGKKGTVRLDHAATVETAYDDLQNILGNDGISRLTDDTKKLMSQQKNLFNVMNELAPAVKETMSMLQGLDLNGITNMSNSTSNVADQLKQMMSTNKVVASNDKTSKK